MTEVRTWWIEGTSASIHEGISRSGLVFLWRKEGRKGERDDKREEEGKREKGKREMRGKKEKIFDSTILSEIKAQ